ncbi:zinc finger protein 346 [Protopterus annectens]|uniref:zinc finger protein 346 n=1 Tax=Protopterus annectens TaxID=7888 RepID=UPI001CF9AA4C|nr:zinc finger protein 346 [Protopterus annectens]
MADESSIFIPKGATEVNRMIRENRHIFTDGQCKVCNAVLISESQKIAHYESKKHANKYRRYMSLQSYPKTEDADSPVTKKAKNTNTGSSNGEVDRNKCCPVCNMTFSSPVVAESHYQGKVHYKNLKLKYPDSAIEAPSVKTPTSDVTASNDPEKYCKTCKSSFNNPLMAEQHYVGKKHKKQENKQKLTAHFGQGTSETTKKTATETSETSAKGYPCDSCRIVLNSVEQYQAHVSGAKHKNLVKSAGKALYKDACNSYLYTQEERVGGDIALTARILIIIKRKKCP